MAPDSTARPDEPTAGPAPPVVWRLASYLQLLTIGGLLLPIPKTYLALTLFLSLLLFFFHAVRSRPAAALIFLVYLLIPLFAFQAPPFMPISLPPLFKLAAAIAIWGIIMTVLVSLITLTATYIQSRPRPADPFPPDHAPSSPD